MEQVTDGDGEHELVAVAARLGAKVDRLTDAVDRLDKRYAQLESRTGTVERRSARTVIVSVLIAAGMVTGALLGYSQLVTNDHLEVVEADQRRVTQEVLCPLFALVVGSYDPDSRAAGPAREQYVATFAELTRIYMRLQCTTPTVPPREPDR